MLLPKALGRIWTGTAVNTQSEMELIAEAFRDQARLYRHLRRCVTDGTIDHYTVEECTNMMNQANINAEKYNQIDN